MDQDLLSSFRDALLDFLTPVIEAAGDPVARAEWLSQLGYTASITGAPELNTIFAQASAIKTELVSLNLASLDSLSGLQSLLQTGRSVSGLVSAIKQFVNDPSRVAVAGQLAEELMALLLANYLRRNHMTLFRAASVLNLVQAAENSQPAAPIVQNGATVRFSPNVDQFNFNAIGQLFSNPFDVLGQYYFPNNLQNAQDAQVAASRIFGDVGLLANAIGVSWQTNYALSKPDAPAASDDNEPDDIPEGFETDEQSPDSDPEDVNPLPVDTSPLPDSYFATTFPGLQIALLSAASAPGSDVSLEFQCSSASHPGGVAGFIASVAGNFNAVTSFDSWRLTLASNGQIPAFVIKPDGVALAPAASPLTGGAASILLERLSSPDTGSVFLFGAPTGTRLEIGAISLRGDLSFDPAHIDASIGVKAAQCSFVLKPSDGDSFLSTVLPQNGLTAQFDLGLTYSSDRGLTIQGGAGVDATIPIGISIGDVVSIPSLHLALIGDSNGLQAEVSASAALSIGPIAAVVDRVGATLSITFPAGGGNFGPIDLGVNFKAPSGVGLSIDDAGVSGGGFLTFDSSAHQYSGVLQLKFNDIALQAFGLITTQVAGANGYSLLALIDADFPPIQLGWGFTLNGVGGIMAANRTADVDALRASLKANKIASILFPTNAITSAPQVLAQLDALFPTAQGRFLFGPMALIGWGTPTILTAALAVILELPEPVRIILLARITAALPSQSNALVRINMDALGVLDLSQDSLSLDATLFDSKLVGFTLSGDMSLRANWASNREFLLAIGGFHPQFTPPPGFPALNRITIDMPNGAITKMRLAAYLAITSNSLQFGANLDVFIGVAGFGLSGHLGFDALLQIDPFLFNADISGRVALTASGDDLMSVGLDASLSGPAPWHIAGKFKVHIVFFTVHKSFSMTWGGNTPAVQIPAVNVLPLLTAALADPRNWTTQPSSDIPTLVSVRSQDGSTLIVHPMAQLEVHETVVPLGLQITRFGSAAISGANTFTITGFSINGSTVLPQTVAVQDDFAPAQFFDLSDTDKLAGPSFEQQNAGLRLVSGAPNSGPAAPPKKIAYETSYIDGPGADLRPAAGSTQATLTVADLQQTLSIGASARADIRSTGKLQFQAPGNPVSIAPQKFAVANTNTLAFAGIGSASGTTYSGAKALLATAIAKTPSLSSQLQIVAIHEMAAA